MAEIRPFFGVRYNQAVVGDLAGVVAAPYDIITPAAQEAYYQRSAHNVVRLELGLELGDDSELSNRYTRAAETYRRWIRDGVLRVDAAASFYLYEERFEDQGRQLARRSLFAPVKLANWEERVVLPHEFTMPGPKVDRLNLLAASHAQFSPLLAMYDDPGSVRDALAAVSEAPPTAQFSLKHGDVAAAASEHRVWQISDAVVAARLTEAFRPLQIYIADGHHRYETALVYRDRRRAAGAHPNSASEYVLMALVDLADPGMLVRPTHRLLHGIGPIDTERVLRALDERFEVERIPLTEPGAMPVSALGIGDSGSEEPWPSFAVLGLEAGWCHRLTLRRSVDLNRALPGVPDVLRALDTVVLQRLIFEPIFGLTERDVEAGDRIQYTRDPDEATRAFASGQAQIVVFLNPTPMAQIRAAARAGERMPQKTTYFYPKPVTGLVFFDHDRSL